MGFIKWLIKGFGIAFITISFLLFPAIICAIKSNAFDESNFHIIQKIGIISQILWIFFLLYCFGEDYKKIKDENK